MRLSRPVSFALLTLLVAAAVIALTSRGPQHRAHEPKTAPGDWFYTQRAWPLGTIDAGKLDQARAQLDAMRDDRLGTQAAGGVWTPVGPYNIGGRVTALAAKPGSPTVWLGAAFGGVWRSTNGGTNWTCTTDRTPIASVGALAIDPANDQVIWAGTGEANASVDSYDGNGLWVTRDGGSTWNHAGLTETRRIAAIAVDPSNSQRVFVAAMGAQFSTDEHRGLYRSEDGGASWTKVLFVNDSTGVCDIVMNPAHPETMFCASWERVRRYTYRRAFGPGGGVWRSVDGGTSWTKLAGGLPPSNDDLGRIALSLAPSRPSTVYAQIGTGSALGYRGLGFYRTLDAGNTWTRRDGATTTFANAFGGFCWYFGETGVDPANPERVWAMGVSLLRSEDGGATWSTATGTAHVDQHAIWVDPSNPSRVLLGNDGGYYSTNTGGAPWTKSLDLPISQFYAGSVAPYDANKVMGGTQDNNSLLTSSGPSNWFATLGGDGFVALADPVSANVLFAEWQNGCDRTGPRRSTNNGSTWVAPTGFSGTDRFNWNTPYVMNPRNRHVLLAGSHRVYRSTDNGVSYVPISGDLTRTLPSLVTFSTISTVAISAADTSLYYAGTDDGRVWRSGDRGASWQEISAGLPLRAITRVAPDPSNANVVLVTLSGFGQDETLAHVWRSTDRGDTWVSVSGNLPDVPANDVIVDPLDPATFYLGTDLGVMITRNGGATWWEPGAGLPRTSVFDLELHASSRQLFAFTHGRSAWKLNLADLPVGAPAAAAPAFALSAAAPNPSAGVTRVTLSLDRAARVQAAVFDAQGRRVADLGSAERGAGRHVLAWDGRTERGALAPAGVYWLRVHAGGASRLARLVRVE